MCDLSASYRKGHLLAGVNKCWWKEKVRSSTSLQVSGQNHEQWINGSLMEDGSVRPCPGSRTLSLLLGQPPSEPHSLSWRRDEDVHGHFYSRSCGGLLSNSLKMSTNTGRIKSSCDIVFFLARQASVSAGKTHQGESWPTDPLSPKAARFPSWGAGYSVLKWHFLLSRDPYHLSGEFSSQSVSRGKGYNGRFSQKHCALKGISCTASFCQHAQKAGRTLPKAKHRHTQVSQEHFLYWASALGRRDSNLGRVKMKPGTGPASPLCVPGQILNPKYYSLIGPRWQAHLGHVSWWKPLGYPLCVHPSVTHREVSCSLWLSCWSLSLTFPI